MKISKNRHGDVDVQLNQVETSYWNRYRVLRPGSNYQSDAIAAGFMYAKLHDACKYVNIYTSRAGGISEHEALVAREQVPFNASEKWWWVLAARAAKVRK